MIFPERVFGSASVNRISSGVATGPMTVRTCFFSSAARSLLVVMPLFTVTKHTTA